MIKMSLFLSFSVKQTELALFKMAEKRAILQDICRVLHTLNGLII